MSLIRSIENNIKGFFKVCFFLWMMTYIIAIFQIIMIGNYNQELKIWSDAGFQAFTIILCNVLIPYYFIKALMALVRRYPAQAKMVFSAMLMAAAYEIITKRKP